MFNINSKEKRAFEEILYTRVAEEMENQLINKGLWTKALAESNNDEKQAEALYIKLRVQKLKDEIDEAQSIIKQNEREAKNAEYKNAKEAESIAVLNNIVKDTEFSFKMLSILMFATGCLSIFFAILMFSSNEWWSNLFVLIATFLTPLGLYLFYLCFKIKKSEDKFFVKRKLDILFTIMIPFSLIGTVVGAVSIIIGIALFFTLIGLIKKAYQYNKAFSYATKHNLV